MLYVNWSKQDITSKMLCAQTACINACIVIENKITHVEICIIIQL